MSKTILQETLDITETALKPYFLPPKKALALIEWLDPERYPSVGTFNLEDAYEFLPAIYQALADNLSLIHI